jgi:hypothetical protein
MSKISGYLLIDEFYGKGRISLSTQLADATSPEEDETMLRNLRAGYPVSEVVDELLMSNLKDLYDSGVRVIYGLQECRSHDLVKYLWETYPSKEDESMHYVTEIDGTKISSTTSEYLPTEILIKISNDILSRTAMGEMVHIDGGGNKDLANAVSAMVNMLHFDKDFASITSEMEKKYPDLKIDNEEQKSILKEYSLYSEHSSSERSDSEDFDSSLSVKDSVVNGEYEELEQYYHSSTPLTHKEIFATKEDFSSLEELGVDPTPRSNANFVQDEAKEHKENYLPIGIIQEKSAYALLDQNLAKHFLDEGELSPGSIVKPDVSPPKTAHTLKRSNSSSL